MFPDGVTPDVLIVPSQLKLLAKPIEGVVCVNPGYMVKGDAAGSYATITIDALTMPLDERPTISKKAQERIRVDITNI